MDVLILPVEERDITDVYNIYMEAFPEAERKPFEMLLSQNRDGSGELCTIYVDDVLSGFFHTFFYNDYALIDYFAISDKFRGKGIGQKAISEYLKKYSNKRVFLEIEDHMEGEIQKRRLDFYRRCGFTLTDTKVFFFGVPMELMTYMCDIDYDTYYNLYKLMLGEEKAELNIQSRN